MVSPGQTETDDMCAGYSFLYYLSLVRQILRLTDKIFSSESNSDSTAPHIGRLR